MSHAPPRDDDRTPAGTRPGAVFGPYLGHAVAPSWVLLGLGPRARADRRATVEHPRARGWRLRGPGDYAGLRGDGPGHHRDRQQLAAAAAVEWRERPRRSDEAFLALASPPRVGPRPPGRLGGKACPSPAPANGRTDSDRSRLVGEIGQAIRAGGWTDADRLLDEFESSFPGDPAAAGLRERREGQAPRGGPGEPRRARRRTAGRNDPDRVLGALSRRRVLARVRPRGELKHKLSRWFLQLIHRRLRIVPIQPDVVRLATEVAETFGGTAGGASLRASLPMLRRSVGLCPRCAQPYVGAAAACPQCLTGRVDTPSPGRGEPDSQPEPDADDPDLDPDTVPRDDRDDGWTRYDEDDSDDLDPPA